MVRSTDLDYPKFYIQTGSNFKNFNSNRTKKIMYQSTFQQRGWKHWVVTGKQANLNYKSQMLSDDFGC